MPPKKTRINQVSRLLETKKLKRSDNSASFQDLGHHLLAAGAGTPDPNIENRRIRFGATIDGKITDIIKSSKTTNTRVLNIIN